MIRVNNINKSYGEKKVIGNISLEYKNGETYILNSPSGSGKTTLLRIIAGLEKPDSGEVVYDGTRRRISFLFQEDRLLEKETIADNLRLVLKGENYEEALRDVHELIPEADVNDKVSEMSFGMKRRLAVIRAVRYDSDVLILDEPFLGLDEENIDKVKDYIKRGQRGRTVIMASHVV